MRFDQLKRRGFITLLGGAAAAWPLAARAQQRTLPVVGFLNAGAPRALAVFAAAFRQGLEEIGYVEGRNVVIEYRWAGGAYDRLPQMTADLVVRRVAIIAVFGVVASRIAKAAVAGSSIPMVFANGGDPVADGLVSNLSRPGGNITGITSVAASIVPKRLEFLRAAIPSTTAMAIVTNPDNPFSVAEERATQEAARDRGQQLEVLTARNESEIEAVFATITHRRISAVIISTDLLFFSQMERFATLSVRNGVPASAPYREFPVGGGLMSYGASITEAYRQAGVYTGRILKGEKPGDLPVLQPTKFDLIINLRTVKALGLTLPPTLLALVDEVIE
jgi:putative tryptophan/tyrosine transport system substrate-binding protein